MRSTFFQFSATFLVFLLSSNAAFCQLLQDSTYSKKEIVEDLNFLKDFLQAVHPALYEYQTEDEFELLFAKAKDRIKPTMTEWDVLNLIAPIAKSIGCGHTTVGKVNTYEEKRKIKRSGPYALESSKFLPFRGRIIGDQLFIGDAYDTTLVRTTEVLAIDDHSVTEILDKISAYPVVSEDGNGRRLLDYYSKNGVFEHIYRYFYPIGASVKLKLKKDGQVFYINPTTFSGEDLYPISNIAYQEDQWRKIGIDKDSLLNNVVNLYQNKSKKEVALLEIQTFGFDSKKRISKIFQLINQHNITHLIIDLRGNLGGKISVVNRLLTHTMKKSHTFRLQERDFPKKLERQVYRKPFSIPLFGNMGFSLFYKKYQFEQQVILQKTITPNEKVHFDGNLYVLIDGGSFSGSSLYSAIIQNQGGATFIGEETGGAQNVTNGARYFFPKLPNSKCTVRVPRYRINHRLEVENKGRGVIPDYEVKETVESFNRGEDPVLKKVMEVIGGK